MVVAPHPDDESLATGALLQMAAVAGAGVRVLFITDGDNNPWPQRVIERKVRISAQDRVRWGMRRRKEALAALQQLGLKQVCAAFLAFPDQGMSRILMGGEDDLTSRLTDEIRNFQPTILAIPSPYDLHPDHNALFVLLQLARMRAGLQPGTCTELRFLVHTRGRHGELNRIRLNLGPVDKTIKREAILRHTSQMKLSRKRFLAYVKESEIFYRAAPALHSDTHHPIVAGSVEDGALRLLVHLRKRSAVFSGKTLLVAIESLTEGSVRWALPLRSRSCRAFIRNAVTGKKLRLATIRVTGHRAEIKLPVASLLPMTRIFTKLQQRVVFFDESGWREIPVAPAPVASGKNGALVATAA